MRDEPVAARELANSTCKKDYHFIKQAPDVEIIQLDIVLWKYICPYIFSLSSYRIRRAPQCAVSTLRLANFSLNIKLNLDTFSQSENVSFNVRGIHSSWGLATPLNSLNHLLAAPELTREQNAMFRVNYAKINLY